MSTRRHGDRIAALAGVLASALLAGHACDAADECEGSSCGAEQDDHGQCERDEDCDAAAGEVCVDVGSLRMCGTPAGLCADADCDADRCETCDAETGQCATSCSFGEECWSGMCEFDCEGCGGHHDCYPIGFCGAEPGQCQSCYTLGDECERAQSAPAADTMAGPTLFYATQDAIGSGGENCRKDPANCQNNGNVCQFTAGYYDPNGDVGISKASVYGHLFFIVDGGSRVPAYDADATTSPGTVTFRLCYDEATVSLGGAVQLDDDAGHHSNATCIEGTAP